jgi:hypothetical protein
MRIPTRLQFGSLVAVLVCLSAALVLSGCKKTPQQRILGKWSVDGDQSLVEYRKDGTFVTTQNGKSSIGKYQFSDDSHLELEVSGMQGTNNLVVRLKCDIVFHGDKADLTATLGGTGGGPSISRTVHYTRAD